jgi:thiol-disulfide isomerase/thioredoxin
MKSLCFLTLSLLAVLCARMGVAQETKVTATLVKYDGLKQEIHKNRGKVVVVDFWSTRCPPCMKAFPKFIEMQKKYADKGLVVISVWLDDASDPELVASAHKFLTRHQSPLRNLLLDEPSELWAEKFQYRSLPFYYVFDRHGKWVRFPATDVKDGTVDYAVLEGVVAEMLNNK